MNFKDAITNVSKVPNKFDIVGGNLTGSLLMNNSTPGQIKFKNAAGSDSVIGMYLTNGDNLRIGGNGLATQIVPGTITLECTNDPKFRKNFGGTEEDKTYTFYHTGYKPTAADVAAVPLAGGTMTGALKLKGTTMTSSINCNKTTGREELQIYASGAAYLTGSKGAGMHLYGNNDLEHSGNIAFMTGDNDKGTARMIISQKGNVTIGHTIWDFVDENKDTKGLVNIKAVSGKTGLIFHGISKTDGEIAVPSGENFSIGQIDAAGTTFTSKFEIQSTGNVVINDGELYVKTNKVFHAGSKSIALTNTGTVGQSTKQVVTIAPGTVSFSDTIEGTARSSSIGSHNGTLELYSNRIDFYPGTSGAVFNGNVTLSPSLKSGCIITNSGLDSIMYGGFNMGESMPLGYITCMSVAQMSDRETKEEIKYINNNEEKITSNDCYNFFLNDFKPVSFKYKNRTVNSPQLGFIAQDVEETKLSDFILVKKENSPLSFNNYSFTSALAIAFQKALKEIESLKNEIKKFKK